MPCARRLKESTRFEDGWLEEKLRELLAAMLASQHALKREVSTLPAVRASTREELWRRVNRARDYLHAHLAAPISLSEVAAAACLSPFHLLTSVSERVRSNAASVSQSLPIGSGEVSARENNESP